MFNRTVAKNMNILQREFFSFDKEKKIVLCYAAELCHTIQLIQFTRF